MFLSSASNCAVPALTSPLGGGYLNNIRHILELTSHFGAIKKEVLCGLKFQSQICFKSDLYDLQTRLLGHGIGWGVVCSLVLPSTAAT